MALRTYGKQTLNDNWTEERAPALKGVIADYGNLEYGTTFGSDFARQPKQGWLLGHAAQYEGTEYLCSHLPQPLCVSTGGHGIVHLGLDRGGR